MKYSIDVKVQAFLFEYFNSVTNKFIFYSYSSNVDKKSRNRKYRWFVDKKSALIFVLKIRICCPRRFAVLAVLDFQIPCFRPETPALYPRSLLTNNEGRGQNENVRADFEGGNEGFKDPDQWGRRRPEEPCLNQQITILNYGPDKLL